MLVILTKMVLLGQGVFWHMPLHQFAWQESSALQGFSQEKQTFSLMPAQCAGERQWKAHHEFPAFQLPAKDFCGPAEKQTGSYSLLIVTRSPFNPWNINIYNLGQVYCSKCLQKFFLINDRHVW